MPLNASQNTITLTEAFASTAVEEQPDTYINTATLWLQAHINHSSHTSVAKAGHLQRPPQSTQGMNFR